MFFPRSLRLYSNPGVPLCKNKLDFLILISNKFKPSLSIPYAAKTSFITLFGRAKRKLSAIKRNTSCFLLPKKELDGVSPRLIRYISVLYIWLTYLKGDIQCHSIHNSYYYISDIVIDSCHKV